jgi:hypothetical protein
MLGAEDGIDEAGIQPIEVEDEQDYEKSTGSMYLLIILNV